ncbi:DUF4905 domain-containing protein [Mucilaginibacter conchicola]|uniref:DUF4905 domain-containing protein n=1 Tax=Mucilaginibacter conchicola TaxID=2303333 RepID=A0A372NQX8_9SPHI|nr:DUF4905 domain-containing protein [Mucilaginibacter conchicola]RFZ91050.1 DUF4905 domain-containing protein [Mucilaginibacter conchicola]
MTLLQPFISHTFNGHIWRLQIDELTGILALEIRNEQDKQTSFAALSLQTGEVYFDAFTLPERWFTGIEAVYNGVLLLHYYKHESSPEHKSIIGIDARTGKELWADYSLTFDHLSNNGPAVYNANIQPKKMLLLSVENGKTVRNFSEDEDKPLHTGIVIPYMVTPRQVLPGILPDEPYGNMVHYMSHDGYIIVSLHTLKNGVLQQHLYIMADDKIVYHDLLNSDIQKLQPEAFVVHNNALVYIKNKVQLIAVQL